MVDPFDATGRRIVSSKARRSAKRQLPKTIRIAASDLITPPQSCSFMYIANFFFSLAITLDKRKGVEGFGTVLSLFVWDLQYFSKQVVIEPAQHRCRIERVAKRFPFCFRTSHKQKFCSQRGLS